MYSQTIDMSSRVEAANAAEYAAAPFTEGLTGEDFRTIANQGHGRAVRWWQAMTGVADNSGRDGITLEEVSLSSEIKVLVFNDGMEVTDPEFGRIRIGDIRHSGMPDEIELAIHDRTLYPDRYHHSTEKITPSGTQFDNLNHLFVVGIHQIKLANGTTVDALKYELYGRQIKWRDPSYIPSQPYSVRYRWNPQYEFRGDGERLAPLGEDDVRLPQIVPLHLVPANKERET